MTSEQTTTNKCKTPICHTSELFKSDNDIKKTRKKLFDMGINVFYNAEIIHCNVKINNRNKINTIYGLECNGLILNATTYEPLVIPTHTLKMDINVNKATPYLTNKKYYIYKALDGTCFNMYWASDSLHYFNTENKSSNDKVSTTSSSRWYISTANSHYMNNTKWSDKTMQDAVTDCLAFLGYTWEQFCLSLNKNKCYTFIFKHPTMHKFQEGKVSLSELFFVQSVNLNKASKNYLKVEYKTPVEIISEQPCIDLTNDKNYYKNLNFKSLFRIAKNALLNYQEENPNLTLTSNIQKNNINYFDLENTKNICYGFILRAVDDSVPNDISSLYIESSISVAIRKFWYDNNIIDYCHTHSLDKEYAITLYSFLRNTEDTRLFRILFPQYNVFLERHHTMLWNISKNVAHIFKSQNIPHEEYKEKSTIFYNIFVKTIKYKFDDNATIEYIQNKFYQYILNTKSFNLLTAP